MRKMIKDERGFAGVYILGIIFVTCIIFMAVYFAIAGQAMNVRTYALSQIEQAGEYTLEQVAEYDLQSNQFVIPTDTASMEKIFKDRISLNHYTVNKFLVLAKNAKDPQGYTMAQPGVYIELNLPLAGFNVPVGEDVVLPPYNEQTKTWIK